MDLLHLALLQLLVLILSQLLRFLYLLCTLLILELQPQLPHLFMHGFRFCKLGIFDELKDPDNVRLNFHQLLGRLGLIGTFGSLFVDEHSNVRDLFGDFIVCAFTHQVLATLGCLHLEDILLVTDSASALLVLFNSGLKGADFSDFILLDHFKFLALSFSL